MHICNASHLGSALQGRAASPAGVQSRSQTHQLAPFHAGASHPRASGFSWGCSLVASSSAERLKSLEQ